MSRNPVPRASSSSPAAARAVRLATWVLAVLLVPGCNSIFDISEGTPRPLCADSMLIDDMEDGDDTICPTSGRVGGWYGFGDGTVGAELTPSTDGAFEPSPIEDGARGTSRYAARLRGHGFEVWGAVMGVGFRPSDRGYDASDVAAGIRFWMRSSTPVIVNITTPATILIEDGGECADLEGESNCNNHFQFSITAPGRDWVEYEVPFNALRQARGGSATWNPRRILAIQFNVPSGVEFDVSVDDLSFYQCVSGCQPTCTDPAFPLSCRATYGPRSSCQPPGADCDLVARGLGNASMVAMGGGDSACIGLPSEQLPRCFLNADTGIPFANRVNPLTDGVANARLRNPEPGKVCMQGTMGGLGAAAITFIVSPIETDFPPLVRDPFDLRALDIAAIELTITEPPAGGVSLELRSLVQDDCPPNSYCLGPTFSWQGPNVLESSTVRAEVADFEPADPGPVLVLSVYVWGHSTSRLPTNYDFCLQDVKFLDSQGAVVSPP